MSKDSIIVELEDAAACTRDRRRLLPTAYCLLPTARQRGFTLLEMVMVMTIIVILATIGITSYQKVQLKAKETLLKDDLNTMRKLIDQYEADREQLPQSLDDLVSAGYLREVPIDPITGEKDWTTETGESTVSRDAQQGIINVHSNAAGEGSDGKVYSEY